MMIMMIMMMMLIIMMMKDIFPVRSYDNRLAHQLSCALLATVTKMSSKYYLTMEPISILSTRYALHRII